MSDYTSKQIKVLSPRDHVRLRLQVYAGNTEITKYQIPLFVNNFAIKEFQFRPSLVKVISEIFDNVIDEFAKINSTDSHLIINADSENGFYEISDNGRGVPIDMHESGIYTPELVFSRLNSGRNFIENKEEGVQGMNGLGSKLTNFCSTSFKVEICRDNKKYTQLFEDGTNKIHPPEIVKFNSKKTGTKISFKLDKSVFTDIELPDEFMKNKAIELALNNPNITVTYNGTDYKFKNGFDNLISKISTNYFKFGKNNKEFYIILDTNHENIFTWVNSSFLYEGGICNTQIINSFAEKVMDHLSKDAKKNKCIIYKEDILKNLLFFGNLKISDPKFDSQSKVRLTSPSLKKEFIEIIDEQWPSFARKNKDWLQKVLELSIKRHSFTEDTKAIKDLKKNSTKKIPELMDATSKNIFERKLLLCEGLSAKASISEARDPKTIAAFALTGKLNNVYGSSVAELLKMGKITDLLAVIGLVPGQKAVRSNLRYGKIIIACDADYDGSHLNNLLVNVFYQFWPELFDKNYPAIIHRLIVPNICLLKKDKRIHITSRLEYEKVKDQYKGYEVKYFKGLGSMSTKDWELVLSDDKYLIPFLDDGNLKNTLQLIFSENIENRKEWLQHE